MGNSQPTKALIGIRRSTRGHPTTASVCLGSTHVCLGYGIRIEEVAPARELAITHSEQMEEVGLAGLAGGLDAQSDVPRDDHIVTLNDEFPKVHRLGRQMTLQSRFAPSFESLHAHSMFPLRA
jgi:hypothetical protein